MKFTRRESIKMGATLGAGLMMNPLLASSSSKSDSTEIIRVGFVGIGARGTALLKLLVQMEGIKVPALCDINKDNLELGQKIVEDAGQSRPEGYSRGDTDFIRMCDRADLDLVMTATPWEWHTPVCLAAMNAGKAAVSEVPIAVTEEECWQLVETSERTGKLCTMLENVCYVQKVMAVSKMIRRGQFGKILHAQVGYQHDIRPARFNEKTLQYYNKTGLAHWRIRHHEKNPGNLYPTHPLSAVAQWMDINRGDQFSYLVSMETPSYGMNIGAAREFGKEHPLAKKKYIHGDINTTLIKTEKGRTITLYHDVGTYRPYDFILRVQGTEGIYESNKGIYIEGLTKKTKEAEWSDFEEMMNSAEYKPKLWAEQEENVKATGASHGGGDYMELYRLFYTMRNGLEPDIDIYDAVSWSVIRELSGRSVRLGSKPIQIPDFTKGTWVNRKYNSDIFFQ